MVNGVPPFLGDSQIDQLKGVIKILGTPSESEVGDMNKAFDVREVKRLPQIKKIHWSQVCFDRLSFFRIRTLFWWTW